MEPLCNLIQAVSSSYSAGLQLLCRPFLIIGHVAIIPTSHWMQTHRILFMLFFFTFSQTRWYFHFWIYAEDLEWILKAVHDILNSICIFLLIFWVFLAGLPYLEVIPGLWKCHSTSSPTMSTIFQFSLNFLPFFLAIFGEKAHRDS